VPGFHEDHWIVEYWDESTGGWTMVDAQLDAVWQGMLGMSGEIPRAVGPGEFLTAGHAWQAWRRGELDAQRCGLSSIPEYGASWIASNLRLDLAALNKVEMLPWDIWGLGWEPPDEPTTEMLDTFDAVAELTVEVDDRLADLRARYELDSSLRMDGVVYSVMLGERVSITGDTPSS
jgi:hypothetical protein